MASSNYEPISASTWLLQTDDPGMGKALVQSPDCTLVTTETILEYIVANFGCGKTPQLAAALSEHASLDTLIPVLFGVSCADFELAWQSYLAQHY